MRQIVVSLAVIALAVAISWLATYQQRRQNRADRLRFRFLRIRDQLQFLAVTKKLEIESPTYSFAMWIVNVAARNAGTLRLRDAIWIADQVDERVRRAGDMVWKDILGQPHEVHVLLYQLFLELGKMMAANDPLVALGFRVYGWRMRRERRSVLEQLDRVAARLMPRPKVDALERAKGMVRLARDLGPQLDSLTYPLFPGVPDEEVAWHSSSGTPKAGAI